jgi:DNA-binding XRE family transcriptional regulator/type II secretory pathway predicted ATPase ExeA
MTRSALAVADLQPEIPESKPAPTRGAPTTPPLDERSWAEAYRKENGITKAAMAEKIGYSRTAYGQWEDGSYAGDADQVAAAIRALRDRIEGPGGLSAVVGFRETGTSRVVAQAIDLADKGELMVLIGESGVGKSEAMKEAVRRASRNGGAMPLYMECTVFTSAFALVSALGREMGLEKRPNPDALLRDIAGKLRRTPRTILLDEAHYAHPKAIEALRQIRDQSGCGCALAGTAVFAGLGYGQLGKGDLLQDFLDHRPHLEQVIGRAIIWQVPGLRPDEVESIARDVLGPFTAEGLERLQQRVGESIRRLVRLVQQIRDTRKIRRRTGPVEEGDVELAWTRMYLRKSPGAR